MGGLLYGETRIMMALWSVARSSGLDPLSSNSNSFETFMDSDQGYKTYLCLICGYIYDEEMGAPEDGIAPGTRWTDVPLNWVCPECGARKEDFELIEI